MFQENVEVVRNPLRLRGRSRRSFDQRLALRFPRFSRQLRRVVWSPATDLSGAAGAGSASRDAGV